MNRITFIKELTKELQQLNVSEIKDIISDFNEHFDFKLEEGKSEEEIAKKIGNPVDIARDYAKHSELGHSSKTLKVIALVFIDFLFVNIYITLILSVIAIGLVSTAFLILGVSLITNFTLLGLIPTIPYITSLLFGVSLIGLALVSAIGTANMFLYVRQWGKAYLRWHKNFINDNIYPTLSVHPKISKKLSSIFKLINILGVIVFTITFITGYLVATAASGSFEFWHVWNWFQ